MTEIPGVQSLDHLVLTVQDIDATVAFYRDILGMRAEVFHPADGTTRTALCFGAQKINLHPAAAPFEPKAAQPVAGSADLCFLSQTPLDVWQRHLGYKGISIIAGPVVRTGATAAIMSLYLRDPDGNLIEVSNRMPV